VLRRLPTAETFQESHFGEILVGVYGEEILGLRRIYSKLAFLTAENANAYKMDVLFYRPGTDPVQFVLAEVKSSMKSAAEGLPAGHDKSCFASLFASLNKYGTDDLEFDLAAIKERMSELPADEREAVANALPPHRRRFVQYAGFCVIDRSTHHDGEISRLATQRNQKAFDVDLLCVAELPDVVEATFTALAAAVA
jgi:HamA